MANGGAELSSYLEEIEISSIVTIQALVRGFLVRKWLRDLRDVYSAAVTDIERVSNIDVVWRGDMSKPQIVKASWRRKTTGRKDMSEPRITDNVDIRDRLSGSSTPLSGSSTPQCLSPRSRNENNQAHCQSKSVQPMDIQTNTEHVLEHHGTVKAEDKDSMYNTVETQTTMIDTMLEYQNISPQYHSELGHKKSYKMTCTPSQDADKPYADKNIEYAENSKINGMNTPDNMKPVLENNELHLNLEIERTETDCDTVLPVERGGNHSHRSEQHSQTSAQSETSDRAPQLRETSQYRSSESECSQTADVQQNLDIDQGSSCRTRYPNTVLARNQISPLPRGRRVDRQETSTLTNVTSVWDSMNSVRDSFITENVDVAENLPSNSDELQSLRKNITLELLWIQQAINSRKNYLRLKQQM